VTAPPPDPSSPSETLRAFTGDPSIRTDAVAAALAATDPEVDAVLADPSLVRPILAELIVPRVFEFAATVRSGPPIAAGRWAALARAEPDRFVWNIEPALIFPLRDTRGEPELRDALTGALQAAEHAVALNWLGREGCFDDADAVERITVIASGTALASSELRQALDALVRRGGRWEAARAMERALGRARPDPSEAQALQRSALQFADATLMAVLAKVPPWSDSDRFMDALAERVPTEDLIAAFAPEAGEQDERRQRREPSQAHRSAWRQLARRRESAALDTAARVAVRCLIALDDDLLGAEIVGAMQGAHDRNAVAPLVAAYLSGLHRTGAGASLERFFAKHPARAMEAALGLLPSWMTSFEAAALARLCFRVLPKLDARALREMRSLAEIAGPPRADIVLAELE
jgi:hypothetical protein